MTAKAPQSPDVRFTSRWIRFVRHAAILALLWACLNWADLASWIIGGPAVILAAMCSSSFPGRDRLPLNWSALPGFVLFLTRESIRGGWDVARRVIDPKLPIAPGFVRFRMRLPEGAAQHLFANVISLLPGTVTVRVEGNEVLVHAIDVESSVADGLREIETRVARLFFDETGGVA